MRRALTGLLVVLLMSVAPDAQDAGRLFKAAMNTEVVDGNLPAAIEQYKKVVEAGDRALAAQALLRMAACHEKLGGDEARRIYERLLREYADQADVLKVARARLTSGVPNGSARGDRPVWSGREVDLFGTISPDGRFLTYIDWYLTGNLMLRDLAAGTSRPLTNNTSHGEFGYADWSAMSRRGDEVAYSWRDAKTQRNELRVTTVRGAGVPASRLVIQAQGNDFFRPFDWSPDGQWLAVLVEREDRSSQVGLVRVQDGTLRVLESVDWRGVEKMVFSPDGHHLAYDLAVGEAIGQHHVYVMAVDASRKTAVVTEPASNRVMGWSPGGHLLFASDRTGSIGLWALPMRGGQPQGTATLVKTNIGTSLSLGLTPSGTLYVYKSSGAPYVRVAPLDLNAGAPFSGTSTFERFIESRGRPHWSGDGRHLLFVSCGPTGGGPCSISIWSMDTGAVRDVPHTLGYVAFPRLSDDGQRILTRGRDRKGRRGMYLIDVVNGRTSPQLEPRTPGNFLGWAEDGRSIYWETRDPKGPVFHQRDLESGAEREFYRVPLPGAGNCRLSPDRRLASCIAADPADKASLLVVIPLAGGQHRTVLRAAQPQAILFSYQWTPDSRALVAQKYDPGTTLTQELWLAPIDGEPRKLKVDMSRWVEGGHLQIHPSGRYAAYVANAGEEGAEVWALENFLPAASETSRR